VKEGDTVGLDGFRGTVEINPGPDTVEELNRRRRAFVRLQRRHQRLATGPAETRDGQRILVSANMEIPAELETILERGADGIGLFRTEFFFMERHRAPSEAEQLEVYREVYRRISPRPLVVRVLDLGGDKAASYLGLNAERNPFLGLRGIRFLIAHPELFRTQLRAILRAGRGHPVRLLFPMVGSLSELRAAKSLVQSVERELLREGETPAPPPEIGVMIEVPSAVMMMDEMAAEAEFLSVGSNDLIQYLLAVDRNESSLSHLYQPHHPSVLRALEFITEAAHRRGKPVSLCGEMAGEPHSIPLLLGLGFKQLSVNPCQVPDIKETVRALDSVECRALVEEALRCHEAEEVNDLILRRIRGRYAALLAAIQESNGRETRPATPGLPG
jgi:phosphoenolpyruvate-protein phosphotransferase